MLKWTLTLLLAANLGFYAWSQGWLDPVLDISTYSKREPERLKRQVHPEIVQFISKPPTSPASSAIATNDSPTCFEAGPYTAAELTQMEDMLRAASVPAGHWQTIPVDRTGVWMLYMGRFSDREALRKKETELQRIRIPFEEVQDAPEFEPGLSLGHFDTRTAAENAFNQLMQRGVRTARIVVLTPPTQLHLLRIKQSEPTLQAQLQTLKLPASGKGFRTCANAE